MADVSAAYGLPHGLEYGDFVGLWLNLPRVHFQRAGMTLAGVAAAGHNEPLDPIYFDALARFPEEAQEIGYEINMARWTAKQIANKHRGPR